MIYIYLNKNKPTINKAALNGLSNICFVTLSYIDGCDATEDDADDADDGFNILI